ncbi:spore gernimation protein [Paenibacillus sp. FSL H8-0548]|uniref:GerAB/ArcD/ProY family transporter n=1 Tax=Paenibacillus sp. FSL H8-0548 TaxID=1920422 RepID=UPI00096C7C11|nr:endospore germination permease [Paenibacillus sp. FSL H8-0548]OMF23072.1 spore gernimation protein [Paenibacillus sp. FSL H8-0548]
MEKISLNQLGSMIILFLIGSSSLFLLASDAGKDAWIAVFVGMLIGLVLLGAVNLTLYRLMPELNLVEMIFELLGKPIGYIISFSYVVYFCYKAIRNVREFGDLMIMYLLPETPLAALMLLICAIAAFTVFHGIDVFFRMAEAILPIIVGIYILFFVLIAVSGLLHFQNLTPIMDAGFGPIWDAAFPELISFPFGELVLFLMFWKYVAKSKGLMSLSLKSYFFAGCFITLTNVIIFAGLGNISTTVSIPLMQLTSHIEVFQFLDRIDSFVALQLFTGVFFKLTAYYFGAVLALSYLIKFKRKYNIILIGAAIFIGSFVFRSYMEQVRIGFQLNVKYHFPIFQMLLPLLLLLLAIMKKRRSEKVLLE